MSLLTMPMLVFNLGGEMIYILEQRLRAQSIPDHKAATVLHDVARTMCNTKFLDEVFRPQETFSSTSMRGIFNRLAHSSIMRLSTASMDKLFDLMTMGFKYQSVTCSHPSELFLITMNHVNYLKTLTEKNAAVHVLVQDAEARLKRMYGGLSMGAFAALRQAIASFFQDRRVKVSLFLQDGIQHSDGELALSPGGTLPPGVELPGTVRYFNPDTVRSVEIPDQPTPPPRAAGPGPVVTSLGSNLYAKERPPRNRVPTPEAPGAQQAAEQRELTAKATAAAKHAAQEIDSLATLIGTDDAQGFKISLVELGADKGTRTTTSAVSGPRRKEQEVAEEVFDESGQGRGGKMNAALDAILKSLDISDEPAAAQDEDDDLLAMMDSVA